MDGGSPSSSSSVSRQSHLGSAPPSSASTPSLPPLPPPPLPRDCNGPHVTFDSDYGAFATSMIHAVRRAPLADPWRSLIAARADRLGGGLGCAPLDERLWLEFGVWTGSSIALMARFRHRVQPHVKPAVYGFDSFQGLPEDWRTMRVRRNRTTVDGPRFVKGAFALRKPEPPRLTQVAPGAVRWVVGWFNQSLQPFLQAHAANVSLLHVDCDLYSSTRVVFEALNTPTSRRLHAGAIIGAYLKQGAVIKLSTVVSRSAFPWPSLLTS